MSKKFYITTPIYYVNDVPHIGHAYTTIAADALARYHRLLGDAVFFLTGTDEHGQKVEKAAQVRGLTPQAHADLMSKNFHALWTKLEISNDAFIRTTDKEHVAVVQEQLQKLYDKGEIERRTYEGWYCTPDERFWTEKEIVEGKCPDCGRPVERISEDNYFFLMSKYQGRLIKHIEENQNYIRPESRRNEVLGFLKSQTLGDLCISRPKVRLSWGIELPFDRDFVTYVWFDALINYLSATRYLSPPAQGSVDPAMREKFWWPADHHLVGKDILTTHSVYWSTMLMALDLPLPGNIFAHGWWTREGKKMSKSFGNIIDPNEVVDSYGTDAFRYFVLREVPFGLDGDFSTESFIMRFNTELANDLGNLLSRTLTMITKYRQGLIPEPVDGEDGDFELRIHGRFDSDSWIGFSNFLDNFKFSEALAYLWSVINEANRYIEASAPWKENNESRLSNVLYTLAESLRLISLFVYPVMPSSAQKIWNSIGIDKKIDACKIRDELYWGGLRPRTAIRPGEQLFPRIETDEVRRKKRTEKKMDKGQETQKPETGPGVAESTEVIGIEDFTRADLRAGKIISAERVAKSDKLIKLQVDIGTEHRQVVAGIGKSYAPEELMGKTVVIVTNLKPAKLMGIESRGMLLAASSGDALAVVTLDRESKPGSRVK
ncbi:MAG TPA: methionine--tRNA ligase [Nitrospirota bacterium]|nr:methionine--tRNA ligase [Nitrospirota bacterium]